MQVASWGMLEYEPQELLQLWLDSLQQLNPRSGVGYDQLLNEACSHEVYRLEAHATCNEINQIRLQFCFDGRLNILEVNMYNQLSEPVGLCW